MPDDVGMSPSAVAIGPTSGAGGTPSPFSYDPDAGMYEKEIEARRKQGEALEDLQKKGDKLAPEHEREQQKLYGDIEHTLSSPHPRYPRQQAPEEPPRPEDYRKYSMEWMGAMSVLFAFGGKKVGNAGNAALKGFTGALNGWQEGNATAYKQAGEHWQDSTRRVIEMNRQRLDEYRATLEDRNLTLDEQRLRLQVSAAKWQDTLMWDQTKANNWNGIATAYGLANEARKKMEDASQQLFDTYTSQTDQAGSRANSARDWFQTPQGAQWLQHQPTMVQKQWESFIHDWATPAGGQPGAAGAGSPGGVGAAAAVSGAAPAVGQPGATAAPGGSAGAPRLSPGLTGPPPPNMKPPELAARSFRIEQEMKAQGKSQEEINQYLNKTGQQSSGQWAAFNRQQHPTRSIIGGELERERDRREAAGLPPMTLEEEQQLIAEQRYDTSAMGAAGTAAGRMTTGVAAFRQSLPLASQASTAVGARSKWVPVNQLKQDFALMKSDQAYGNFVIANETAITDYALAIGRGGAMTVHAQERAAKILNTARSDEAYQAGLRQLEREAIAVSRAPAEAKAALLHQLFPHVPQEAIEETTYESVLPAAPAQQQGEGRSRRPAAPDEGWGTLKVQ